MSWHVKKRIRKPAARRDFRPAKEDRLPTRQKLTPFLASSTAGILLLFFFSKETGKKSSKITRSRLLRALVIGLVLQGESSFLRGPKGYARGSRGWMRSRPDAAEEN
jgi:hypothetical protein